MKIIIIVLLKIISIGLVFSYPAVNELREKFGVDIDKKFSKTYHFDIIHDIMVGYN